MAYSLRRTIGPDSILLAKPDHNSLVTLTGRKMYLGYEGTLHSHQIDYKERRMLAEKPMQLISCDRKKDICPDYLLWTAREQEWLRGFSPTAAKLEKTPLNFLYRFPKRD